MMSDQDQRVQQVIENAKVSSLNEQQAKFTRLAQNREELISFLQENLIGTWQSGHSIKTVYGLKPLIYSDYTASGKSLKCFEDYIQTELLPMYANTHTMQSGTGKQTNNAREEARQIIKRVCGGNEDDACIFVGNGTTSAVNLLVNKLRIKEITEKVERLKAAQDSQMGAASGVEKDKDINFCKQNRWGSFDCILCKTLMRSLAQYESHAQTQYHQRNVELFHQKQQIWTEKAVVFLSLYEHNSNLLPWREAGALIELVPLDDEGGLDLKALEKLLIQYKDYPSLKVAAISAGNNITGSIVDVDRISVLCHRWGTKAVFDYAAVSPYVPINVGGVTPGLSDHFGFPPINQADRGLAYKDAVYFSPHKFIGGPQASGVLLAKKSVLLSKKPARAGGGIVFFVDEISHEYVANVEELEEAGTPGVIQDIRAGLVFQLKEALEGDQFVLKREKQIHEYAMSRFRALEDKIHLIGNNSLPKVCIYSFLIRAKLPNGTWKFLNPAFVVSLMNDLFGIQSRSGCLCASMYGQKMLGLDLALSREYKEALFDGNEVLRLGYTRINLNYFLPKEELDYVLSAIEFIAEYGWMFLPHYQFEPETGIWVNREEKESRVRSWLGQIDYSHGGMTYRTHSDQNGHQTQSFVKSENKPDLKESMNQASKTLVRVVENYKNLYGKSELDQRKLVGEAYQRLIWFIFPSEVLPELLQMKYQAPLSFEVLQAYNKQHKALQIEQDLDTTRGSTTSRTDPSNLPFYPLVYVHGEHHPFMYSEDYVLDHQEGQDIKLLTEHLPEKQKQKESINHQEEDKERDTEEAKWEAIKSDVVEQSTQNDYEDEFWIMGGDEEQKESKQEEKGKTTSNQQDIPQPAKGTRPKKFELLKVPKEILSQVGAAIRDFEMIKDGDRVLVALSGGKDSLALIHILRHFQSVAPIKFDLGAVTVDPMVYEYNPAPLIPYLRQELKMPYFLERDAIVERAKTCMQKNSICAFCSRMKRGMIYNCARREGYNVIAMGQHLDDLAESFVMSSFHNGYLRTMKANYTIDKGDLRVIRPLVYCREGLFKDFSQKVNLPVITDNCPACFSAPKERHRIKLMLAQQENLFPGLFQSILKTIMPLMKSNIKDILGVKKGEDSEDEAQEDMLAQPAEGAECEPCCQFNIPPPS